MPILSITGPRQSGKTTLSKMCFPHYDYVNLESPETRQAVHEDPKLFLGNYVKGLIIDEAQRVPELFSWLQVMSDASPQQGQFILTGSQNFLLSRNISQSLAGRVFVSHLLPLSLAELIESDKLSGNLSEAMLKGFYPRVFDMDIEPPLFYPSYSQTYLERDIAGLVTTTNMIAFRKFMELLAGRVGQLINFSSLSIEVGVDYKTIQSWCSILEAAFLIFFLRPYHRNYSKRIIKSPKVYFFDSGLACNLLGIKSSHELDKHWARGSLFENLIIADFMKDFYNRGLQPPLFFWRDNKGLEIDLLIEEASELKAIEIKSGTTVTADYFKNLEAFNKIAHQPAHEFVVYGGDTSAARKNSMVISWRDKGKILL